MPGGRPDDAYTVEPLAANHARVAFACGQPTLDRYLREQARQDAKRSVAATFVAVPRDTKAVASYYTLAATSVDVGELPPAVAAKLPRYPTLPATLLGRLAVDQRHQGCGLGEYLLVHALRRSLTASREIGSLAVIVDAIDDRAYAFYKRYEFVPFPDQSRRLFLPMQSIVRLFGEKT
jgi:GNAT superfamily N-acetyltransferase